MLLKGMVHVTRLALLVLALTSLAGAQAAREMPNFNLLDLNGHNHELQRVEGRAVVLFFTGTGCPIARKSAPKLRQLRNTFGKEGVSFWIINSYAGDTLEDMRE